MDLLKYLYQPQNKEDGYIKNSICKHPDAFYIFEPLIVIPADKKIKNAKKRSDLLDKYFNDCTIPDIRQYVTPSMVAKAKKNRKMMLRGCFYAHMCFRHRSDNFRRQPFCKKPILSEAYRLRDLTKACGPLNLQLASGKV